MSAPVETIATKILIAAPPAAVWAALIDYPRYTAWNPYLVQVEGAAVRDTTIIVHAVAMSGMPPLVQPVTVVAADFPTMRWEGGVPDRAAFKGDHWWTLEPLGTGTLLRHFEHFSGSRAADILSQHRDTIRGNFERFNNALCDHLEQRS